MSGPEPRCNAANFQKVLKDAIATYGIPRKLLLDNGAPYANEQLSLICGALGIVIIHCAPRDGAAKGKQERYWRRVKEQLLFGMDMSEISSLQQFNDVYSHFVHKYNHSFHQGIHEKPYDRFERSGDHMRRPESEEWLNTTFMNRITRKVRGDATVTIQKVLYDVPQQFHPHQGRGPLHAQRYEHGLCLLERCEVSHPHDQQGGELPHQARDQQVHPGLLEGG